MIEWVLLHELVLYELMLYELVLYKLALYELVLLYEILLPEHHLIMLPENQHLEMVSNELILPNIK